jgi:hypothetical protein
VAQIKLLSDFLHALAAFATVIAAVIAIFALMQSADTFQKQTFIQAEQAAHNAVQEHMKLRVEHREINTIQQKLDGSPNNLDELDQDEFNLYQNVANHGIAMTEYVYDLRGKNRRWRDTVEGWVAEYQPFLLGLGIDCGDYDKKFVEVVEAALDTSREDFCQ